MGYAITDTMLMSWRNLLHYVRVPQLIAFAVVQPIMFMVLFVYVFGGAISGSSAGYLAYLTPGIIVQTVIFGSMNSGISIAEDLQKGIMDRFRALPISRGVVLAARTTSDLLRHLIAVLIMAGVGYIMGYRFEGGLLDLAGAFGLIILVGLAFSWVAATIGLLVRDTQTAEIAGFTWIFPVVFASSIFVPVETMPAWLQVFASHSPISLAANAARGFSLGNADWAAAFQATAWMLGITLVFAMLAVWRFRRLE